MVCHLKGGRIMSFLNEWLFIKITPPSRSVLLLLDGHSSHFTFEAIKFAAEKEIILFVCHLILLTCLTLDVSFFAPLKRHWARVYHEYAIDHPGRAVTKFQFSARLGFYPYSLVQLCMVIGRLVYIHLIRVL